MTQSKKRQYLSACLAQSIDWLRDCVADPSPRMSAMHRRIILLAIRKKTRR